MNKRTAKVQRYGAGSLYVALPKDWTRGMEVEAGEVVDIVYDEEVVIRKRRGERDE